MKCRRICRELLWLARFGEFGPSSQPHLDHLAGCQNCRDEVGYDREMVRQLRTALAARIEGMNPSATAWEGILRRAQAPEPNRFAMWWTRSAGVVARLRTATAMAGTGLALLLALNMEIVPISIPSGTDASVDSGATSLQQVPRLPTGRTALVALARQSSGQAGAAARPDPESMMTQVGARISPPPAAVGTEPSEDEPRTELRVVFRATQARDPVRSDAAAPTSGTAEPAPAPVGSEPGQPS
jgi:hypothetical protein